MSLRPWLRRTVWGAFILSLLLHLLGAFNEEIYAWLTKPEFEQTELKKPTRKLKSLSLEEEALLAGVTQPDVMSVYLRHPTPLKPVEKSLPTPVHKRLALAVKPVVASAVVPETRVPVVMQTASAGVAVTASAPVAMVAAASKAVEKINGDLKVASAPAIKSPVQQAGQDLDRFPREMKITYVYGIIPAQMTWKVAKGHYDFRLEGGFLGISRDFRVSGKIDKRGITPDNFFEYRNKNPEPFYQVDFDWQKMSAEVGEPGKRKTESLAEGDKDLFSAAFHVGLMGGSQSEYTFSLFSGRRKYQDVRMVLKGEARLRLGQKEVDALLLRGVWDDRQVDFWLAPEWHNIPVRMTIVLGKDVTLDIWANEITIEGKKVLEWVRPQNKPAGERGGNR